MSDSSNVSLLENKLKELKSIEGIIEERKERPVPLMKTADLEHGYFPFRDTVQILKYLDGKNDSLKEEGQYLSKQKDIMADDRQKTSSDSVLYVKHTEPVQGLPKLVPCNRDPLRETPHLEYFFTWLSLGGMATVILFS